MPSIDEARTQVATANHVRAKFDELVDEVAHYNAQYPSRAGAVAKTELEGARHWFGDVPPPAVPADPALDDWDPRKPGS